MLVMIKMNIKRYRVILINCGLNLNYLFKLANTFSLMINQLYHLPGIDELKLGYEFVYELEFLIVTLPYVQKTNGKYLFRDNYFGIFFTNPKGVADFKVGTKRLKEISDRMGGFAPHVATVTRLPHVEMHLGIQTLLKCLDAQLLEGQSEDFLVDTDLESKFNNLKAEWIKKHNNT